MYYFNGIAGTRFRVRGELVDGGTDWLDADLPACVGWGQRIRRACVDENVRLVAAAVAVDPG